MIAPYNMNMALSVLARSIALFGKKFEKLPRFLEMVLILEGHLIQRDA